MESDSENEIELKPIKLLEADATGFFKNLDMSGSDEDEIDVKPANISPVVVDELDEDDAAKLTSLNSLPEISKKKYETAYKSFMNWRKHQETPSFSENALLAYFGELAKKMKSSTLWTLYSMLRATLNCNDNVDITKYSRLRAFLKRQNAGYRPKTSKIFTASEIDRFIKEAPDSEYLVTKVALIMGVIGACRRHELYEMKTTHLNDFGSAVLITIPDTKAKTVRNFTITGRFYEIFKKYANLRPENANGHWFFLNYHKGMCTHQRIGLNKLGAMGKQIARYLKLPNPELYTGHCFRRSSAKIIVDARGDITSLKRLSVWKPSRALERCTVEDKIELRDESLDPIDMEQPSTSRDENLEQQENISVIETVMGELNCSNKRPKIATTKIFEPNSHDFAEIRQMPSFVDHSRLLQIFLKSGTTPKLFISAPPHFCKSTNLDMVLKFFEMRDDGKIEEKVGERHMFPTFRDLDIMKMAPLETLEEHFCAHPVLHVDFKEYLVRNFDDALARCFRGIRQAYERHKIFLSNNLQDSDAKEFCRMWWSAKMYQDVGIDNVKAGLESLLKILFAAYGKKVVVLIDECDSIVTAALKGKMPRHELEDIASLMEAILGNVTKNQASKQLQTIFLTGVSHICSAGFLGTITPSRFLDDEDEDFGDLHQMYGVQDSQLNSLLSRVHEEGLMKKLGDNLEVIKKVTRDNFDGYYTRTGKRILPLSPILHFLKSGKSSVDISHPLIQIFKNRFGDFPIGKDILKLLANQEINLQLNQKVNIAHLLKLRDTAPDRDLFFALLLEVGFFTVTRRGTNKTMKIKLANRATKDCFLSLLVDEGVNIGPFQASSMQVCARLVPFIRDSLLNDNDAKYKDDLKTFHTVLKHMFKGFASFQRYHLSEHLLSGLLLMTLGYTKRFSEIVPECYHLDQEQVNLWMLDPERRFAIIFEFRVSRRPDQNVARSVDKTSLFALKELKMRSSGNRDYLLELKNRNIQKFVLVGLSIDEDNKPSLSIETWKNRDEIVCVSENEPIEFEEFYKGCCDLLKSAYDDESE